MEINKISSTQFYEFIALMMSSCIALAFRDADNILDKMYKKQICSNYDNSKSDKRKWTFT